MAEAAEGIVPIGFAPSLLKYMSVVSLTLLICDYLYTLELEVSVVWPRKWTIVKAIFFLARYLPFIDVPMVIFFYFNTSRSLEFFTQDCKRLDQAIIWLITVGLTSTEAILVIRTRGIVGGTRKFLAYLISQYAVFCFAMFAIIGVSTHSWTYGPPPRWSHGCEITKTGGHGRLLFLAFIVLLVHEIIVMVITLYVGWVKYRHLQHTPLIRILYRDGTLYFILTFMVSLASIVNILANSPENTGLFAVFQRVMHAILSTRIILQTRKAASSTEEPIEGVPLSDLHFLTTEGTEATKMTATASIEECREKTVVHKVTF